MKLAMWSWRQRKYSEEETWKAAYKDGILASVYQSNRQEEEENYWRREEENPLWKYSIMKLEKCERETSPLSWREENIEEKKYLSVFLLKT